ncbi:MAG: FtsH protease activity modulator HflK [Candidatus Rariloculaceae bacterium]
MSWNDPDDKDNPWRSNGDKGPADLDAIVRDLQRKLSGLLGGSGKGRGSNGASGGSPGGRRAGSGLITGAAMLLIAVWAFTGFYQVNDAERGIVLRFGSFQALKQPGLQWHIPWPVESVERINTNVTERFPYQGSMLTRDENIVLVDLVVQYRRTDPEAYLFNLRSPEQTLGDITGSAIREVIGKNELDFILTEGRADVSAQAQTLIQATLDAYDAGLSVYEVNLQEANFPGDVEASVQDAIKAREDKERMSFEAQAYANDIVPNARGAASRELQDAEGYRARVIADAEGEASRFSQILFEYERAPAVTRQRMYLETLESILASSTKVLLDTEGSGNGNMIYLPLDRLMERREPQSNMLSPMPPAVSENNNSGARLRPRDLR